VAINRIRAVPETQAHLGRKLLDANDDALDEPPIRLPLVDGRFNPVAEQACVCLREGVRMLGERLEAPPNALAQGGFVPVLASAQLLGNGDAGARERGGIRSVGR